MFIYLDISLLFWTFSLKELGDNCFFSPGEGGFLNPTLSEAGQERPAYPPKNAHLAQSAKEGI